MQDPKADVRDKVLKLYTDYKAAEAAYEDARDHPDDDEIGKKYAAKHEELDQQEAAERGLGELRNKMMDTEAAYEDTGETVFTAWSDAEKARVPVLCKVSGKVIFHSDDTLSDDDGMDNTDYVLRCAIGLPPRPKNEDLEEAA